MKIYKRNGKISWTKLILSLAIPLAVGLLGNLLSSNAADIYRNLRLPSFAPPGFLFMPVWTILYILMGIALYRVWSLDSNQSKNAIPYFFIQLLFNFLWPILFFRFQFRIAAFADILILLFYIIITTQKFYKIDKTAAFLMLPYAVWVAYAALLNLGIILLNN